MVSFASSLRSDKSLVESLLTSDNSLVESFLATDKSLVDSLVVGCAAAARRPFFAGYKNHRYKNGTNAWNTVYIPQPADNLVFLE